MMITEIRNLFRNRHNIPCFEYFFKDYLEKTNSNKSQIDILSNLWLSFLSEDDNTNIVLNNKVLDLVKNSVIDEIPNKRPDFLEKKSAFALKFTDKLLYKIPYYANADIKEFQVKELYAIEIPDGEDRSLFMFVMFRDKALYEIDELYTGFFVNWKKQRVEYSDGEEATTDGDFIKAVITLLFILYAENAPIKKTEKRTKQDKIDKTTTIYIDVDKEYGQKYLGVVSVKGHLRNQAYGPRHSLRKIIYISPYEYERLLKEKESITSTE